ncbi:MAG: hypothetical protein IJE08_03410 [Clostridia bacterium]|nr:hypothetical protein [Clostridia bacterium]
MGYSFSAILIRHGGDPRGLRDRIKEYYRGKGYVQARGADEADVTLRLYADAKHGWAIAAGDVPEEDECIRLSRGLKMPVIRADNFDSDALLLTLTDGKESEIVGFGEMEEEKPLTEETPMWDTQLETEEVKERFSEILKAERVFSEDALTELAPLIGFRKDILHIPMDEDDGEGPKPFCVIRMKDKLGKLDFLADKDAPPAVAEGSSSLDKISFDFYPTGGDGKGIVVLMIACGFNTDRFEIRKALLRPWVDGTCWNEEYWHYADIQRQAFKDGRSGWVMKFPDIEIPRGIKPEVHCVSSKRVYMYASDHSVILNIEPVRLYADSYEMTSWMQEKAAARKSGNPYSWLIAVYPAENPDGGFTKRYPV